MSAADDLRQLNDQKETSRVEHEASRKAFVKNLDEVVRPVENSWHKLKLAISDPSDIQRMSDDYTAIADAIESVAGALKVAGRDGSIHDALTKAKLRLSSASGRLDEDSGRDCVSLLTVLSATLEEPGSAIGLVPHLEMGSFPQNAVVSCNRLTVTQTPRPKHNRRLHKKEAHTAHTKKLFPLGLPRDINLQDAILYLDTYRGSGKSYNVLIQEKLGFSQEEAAKMEKHIRAYRSQGRTTLPVQD